LNRKFKTNQSSKCPLPQTGGLIKCTPHKNDSIKKRMLLWNILSLQTGSSAISMLITSISLYSISNDRKTTESIHGLSWQVTHIICKKSVSSLKLHYLRGCCLLQQRKAHRNQMFINTERITWWMNYAKQKLTLLCTECNWLTLMYIKAMNKYCQI
jgi:hypothetical protein